MDKNMLRLALWKIFRPLMQLVTNLMSPEVGEEWSRELKKFNRKELCWAQDVRMPLFNSVLEPVPFETAPGQVWHVVKDRNFRQIFSSFNVPLEALSWESEKDAQVFAAAHRVIFQDPAAGPDFFFLFKIGSGYKVLRLFCDRPLCTLHPHILPFDEDSIVSGCDRYRIVLPPVLLSSFEGK